jgi:hypothetical protein
MGVILEVCRYLEATSFSIAIRESTWLYPIVESIHVLSLTIFLGLLLLWDLRLVGVALRGVAVSRIWRRLFPWIAVGGALMMVSGVVLFWSDPVRFYGNVFFRVKFAGLLLALLNALAFHFGVERRLAEWDTAIVTPSAARLAGAASIVLWVFVVTAGRFVAYNWFKPLV